jgi:hypothetical protein
MLAKRTSPGRLERSQSVPPRTSFAAPVTLTAAHGSLWWDFSIVELDIVADPGRVATLVVPVLAGPERPLSQPGNHEGKRDL